MFHVILCTVLTTHLCQDPNEEHPELKVNGDNDPIDVVEIGSTPLAMGSITPVKPLGVLAMIDDGELDWKVLAISTNDPLASQYNDIDDVPNSVKDGVREWFRWYVDIYPFCF